MPYYRNIGIIGKARSGKDTIAERLSGRYAYQRVAFADPLKAMAIDINPFIPTGYSVTVRLSELIADVGWEYAKDHYPEVRRILQYSGQFVRGVDPDFWLRVGLTSVSRHNQDGLPVVVSDVRYRNEAESLRRAGFYLIRVTRNTGRPLAMTAQHASETELDDYPADLRIANGGSLGDLYRMLDAWLPPRT